MRYLTEEEIAQLLESCAKQYMQDIIITVVNTGMRRQEVLNLRWDHVRDGFIYLSKTKTEGARQIPINDDLAELFRSIRQRNQLKSEYVFCDEKGKPFRNPTKSFQVACKKARIEDLHFHDLRHTFASRFVMRGGSLKDLQKILGHSDLKMTSRYAHLSQEHKKKSVNLLNGLAVPANNRCHKTVTMSEATH